MSGQALFPTRLAAWLVPAALLLAAGCSGDAPWQTKDITGLMPDLQFELTDHTGEAASAADFRGKPVMLYFGFTHCPDICPTTLATLKRAMMQVGPEADDLRVLFVSVDPERDTVPVLNRYVTAFGERYVGLTGDMENLRRLSRRYRVTFGYGDGYPDGEYEVSHSSAVFVFDKQGQPRLLIRKDDRADAIAQDLRRLLQEE